MRFQRYLADNDYPLWCASSGWHSWERRFVRWAEEQGITLDYAVSSDLEFHPEVLDGHRLMLSVGHDEYWSWGMRDRADDFVESGGSWAIFSGNTCFWQVRYEDDGRTMVCYKGQYAQDPVLGTDQGRLLSSMWSLPSIGRPECLTTGLSFTRGGYARVGQATPRASGGYTVHRPEHPALRGDRPALRRRARRARRDRRLRGGRLRAHPGPRDGRCRPSPTARRPGSRCSARRPPACSPSPRTSAKPPKALWASTEPPGDLQGVAAGLFGEASPENIAKIAYNHAVMGTFTKGKGRVFNAGTTDWAFGLDRDPLVQQVTLNVVRQLGGLD